jgi:phenylacetate-CoA ligase
MVSVPVSRHLRKLLLAYARRVDRGRMLERSRRGALKAAQRAAQRSPAYRRLLQEHGTALDARGAPTDLAALPVLSKDNTFGRFPLSELAGQIHPRELGDVLTSSGRGGNTFGFRLTGRKSLEHSWFDIDLGLQDTFGVDERPTLLVNCLPMGVGFRSRAVTVANVSVREDMACAILRDVGPHFEQTIVCTDPLFVNRLLDQADAVGLDWRALNTSMIIGEEMLVEAQRDYIASHLGIDTDANGHGRLIGSSFGVGELGLNLLFETRESIRLRRAMRRDPTVARALAGSERPESLPSVFCFNPLRCHIEILDPDDRGWGELCFTLLGSDSMIPLPRYTTGDIGRAVDMTALAGAGVAGRWLPWLPVICVKGRRSDHEAGWPSAESVKEMLYADHAVARWLTGAFQLTRGDDATVVLTVQASRSAATELATIESALRRRAAVAGEALELRIVAGNGAPWRPLLDFERKFVYRP